MYDLLVLIVVLAGMAGMVWCYFIWPFRLNRQLQKSDAAAKPFRFGYFLACHYLFFAAFAPVSLAAGPLGPNGVFLPSVFIWSLLGTALLAGVLGYGLLKRYRLAWGVFMALIWGMTFCVPILSVTGLVQSSPQLVELSTLLFAIVSVLITVYVTRRWSEFQ